MQISSFETTQGLERQMSIAVDANEIDNQIELKLKEISRTANMDGFRVGKVPLTVVRKRFQSGVRAEIVDKTIQESLQKAFGEKSLRPASRPHVDVTQDKDGENLAYTATFEVYPEITLVDPTELSIEKPIAAIDDARIDEVIMTLRRVFSDWQSVERAALATDRLTVDMVCLLEGQAVEETRGEDQTIELDQDSVLPELKEKLIGAEVGDLREAEMEMPEDHQIAEISGKTVLVQATVKQVDERLLPEVDEDFIKKCGFSGSVDEMRTDITSNLEKRLEKGTRDQVKQALFDVLLEKHEIDIPVAMISEELAHLQKRYENEGINKAEDELKTEAEKSVKLGLLIGQYVNDHDLKYDQQEVLNAVKDLAMGYQDPQKVANDVMANQGMLQQIIASVLEDKAIDKLLEAVQLTEIEKPFDEIVG